MRCDCCKVFAFKEALCEEDFCKKYCGEGNEDDFIKLINMIDNETDYWHNLTNSYEQTIVKLSKVLLDARPVVRGEWIYKGREPRIEQIYKCSVCERYNREKSNYCPNCGAEMKEKA